MQCPKAAIFDLDDTLAESFQAPTSEMVERLRNLLDRIPVAIMTAASFQRMETQFLRELTTSAHISRLIIFSNVASECYLWKEGWQQEYDVSFSTKEHSEIKKAIEESVAEVQLAEHPKYRSLILERDGKIAYAAIGLDATQEEKKAWDPDRRKRTELAEAIRRRIPHAEISIGGTTTVDITPKGIDKAYGVEWLGKHLGVKPREMLYVGDALFEGGNDAVVITTGVITRAVSGPAETLQVIDELLKVCVSA